MFMKNRNWSFLGLALMCGITLGATQGCDQIQEICDLSCPDEGIAQGNASISGIASVDAFFGSVIAVRDASARLQGNINKEMLGLATVLGVEGAAELSTSDLSAQVSAALDAKISANVSGGISIKVAPPKCEACLEASVRAGAAGDWALECVRGEFAARSAEDGATGDMLRFSGCKLYSDCIMQCAQHVRQFLMTCVTHAGELSSG